MHTSQEAPGWGFPTGWRAGRAGIREAALGGSGPTPRRPSSCLPVPTLTPAAGARLPPRPRPSDGLHPRENLKSSLRAPLPRHPCRVSSHRSLLCMGTLSPDLGDAAEVTGL